MILFLAFTVCDYDAIIFALYLTVRVHLFFLNPYHIFNSLRVVVNQPDQKYIVNAWIQLIPSI